VSKHFHAVLVSIGRVFEPGEICWKWVRSERSAVTHSLTFKSSLRAPLSPIGTINATRPAGITLTLVVPYPTVRTFGPGEGKMTKRLLTFAKTIHPGTYINIEEILYTHYATENGN
jgi:hypothetical protein